MFTLFGDGKLSVPGAVPLILAAVIGAALSAGLGFFFGSDKKSGPERREYRVTDAFLQRQSWQIGEGDSLFVGDSHVQGLKVSAVLEGVLNFGIGLDTVDGLRARLSRYANLDKVNCVFIYVGINDLLQGRSTPAVAGSLRRLAALLRSGKVVWVGVLPVEDPRVAPATVVMFNRLLEEVCAGMERCLYVAPPDTMLTENGRLRSDLHIGDGIHLTGRGYGLFAGHIRSAIAPLQFCSPQ